MRATPRPIPLQPLEPAVSSSVSDGVRFDSGVVSELEYRQVESDLRTTQALPPVIRQLLLRQEGALAVLFGRTPREVYEGRRRFIAGIAATAATAMPASMVAAGKGRMK